ncbi:MAG: P-loop NTPase [bacterium]|nr:P-loop NTPase [bacterium]
MNLTIASGKGGTGKTTVAVNLAVAATREGRRVQLLDCDVEEPNCHLFLEPETERRRDALVPVPEVEEAACNGCGECAAICRYNALAVVGSSVMVFPELCHGCAGCWLVCPEQAITRGERSIGDLVEADVAGLRLAYGRLNVGEALVPPLIAQVSALRGDADLTIVDAPPGTSCSAIAALSGSDYVVLVTEPTPFGLNDLVLAADVVRQLELPCGVVINRAGAGDDRVHDWCRREGLEILLEIPDDRRVAEAYARGDLVLDAVPGAADLYRDLMRTLMARAVEGAA